MNIKKYISEIIFIILLTTDFNKQLKQHVILFVHCRTGTFTTLLINIVSFLIVCCRFGDADAEEVRRA